MAGGLQGPCDSCAEGTFLRARGSGQCAECFGSGTNVALNSDEPRCRACKGSGVCAVCGGSGMQAKAGLSEWVSSYVGKR